MPVTVPLIRMHQQDAQTQATPGRERDTTLQALVPLADINRLAAQR
jgi:hypothetical protein